MTDLNKSQFGPWRMTPTMKAVHDYMLLNHVGVKNRGGLWDIAGQVVTEHKNQYLTNAKHENHFEAISRLADNGIVKINRDGAGSGEPDTAWIPVEGEKSPIALYWDELNEKFGGA